MTQTLILNGKFLMAPPTGVHRVAEELIHGLDQLLQEDAELQARFQIEVFAPKKLHHKLDLKKIAFRQGGMFSWIPWEQIDLPNYRPREMRISLCNLGPVASRNAMTMIHDAQVYISPESYSLPFRSWYRIMLPLLGKRHKRILTVSDFSRQQLVAYKVAKPEHISVIRNGVDHILRIVPDKTAPERLGLRKRGYVLSLANIQAHKNIRILLQAFQSAELTDLKLVLYGSADKSELESLLGAPLPANVIVAGRVSDPELRGLIEDALCLAFPSTTEGFGLPPLEAMLLGCPTIVAPRGALPEVCANSAIYADPHDAGDWVARIKYLHDNEDAWADWSRKAQEQARPFTWKRAARQLLELVQGS